MTDIKTFASGAVSAWVGLRYDLVPRALWERLARRFGLGAAKYGELNYRKGLRDREYILDRLNHLQTHLQAYLAPKNAQEFEDDNLGAMAWACAFLCEVEEDKQGRLVLAKIRAERGRVRLIVGKK
ncbi:MAG: dATP/dGTP diphosphohydrolase domain-containing protein [Acidobacteriaceae bacterium]